MKSLQGLVILLSGVGILGKNAWAQWGGGYGGYASPGDYGVGF